MLCVFHFIRSLVKRGDSTLVAKNLIGIQKDRILRAVEESEYWSPKRIFTIIKWVKKVDALECIIK